MVEEKLEQLRKAFKIIIDKELYINYHNIKTNFPVDYRKDDVIDNTVKLLLMEIKIRINNK